MSTVTLLELQQQPAAVLDRVQAGERILVVRDGRAVAELLPTAETALPLRTRGRCAGMFRVPDDFDGPLPEDILQGFEGR
jgi:prevent-host-death family protein